MSRQLGKAYVTTAIITIFAVVAWCWGCLTLVGVEGLSGPGGGLSGLGICMYLAGGSYYIRSNGSAGGWIFALFIAILTLFPSFVLWPHRGVLIQSADGMRAVGLLGAALVLQAISFGIGVRALKRDRDIGGQYKWSIS